MRIIIFEAAGSVGSRTAAEALSRGHEVTAIVRSSNRELPQRVTVKIGDAADPAQVAALAQDHDAAVSAIRAPIGSELGRPTATPTPRNPLHSMWAHSCHRQAEQPVGLGGRIGIVLRGQGNADDQTHQIGESDILRHRTVAHGPAEQRGRRRFQFP